MLAGRRVDEGVAWVGLAVGVAGLVAAGFALGVHLGNLHNGLIAVSFAPVGLYVVRKRPDAREGWLFAVTGAAHAVMFFGRQYALHPRPGGGPLPGATWVGWFGVWPLPLVLVLVGVTIMCFPTGILPSPGWRPVVLVMAGLGSVLAVVVALWPVEYARTALLAPHPLALPGAATADALYPVARNGGYLLLQVIWWVCVVQRLRTAEGDEARQLRWFVFAVVVDAAAVVVGLVVWQSSLPGVLAVPLIPLAAGAAILKYRLYDIDPVINKTLVVGLMAAAVTLGYAVVVVGVGGLVQGHGTALSLLATALVAVVFEPLRVRVQRLADRLVYGHRATPYEALARLTAQLAGPAEGLLDGATGGLLDGMCAAVADGTGARQVLLWTGTEAELRPESGWPASSAAALGPRSLPELDGDPELSVVPVQHDGRFRGAISVRKAPGDPLSSVERRLLADLAAQAGLILELRASAQRLVVAGDAARRKLERNLHDGAQQRLVMVALELGVLVELASSAGSTDILDLADRARAARGHLLQATAELRQLAQGLHPTVLTQDGLAAAVATLADRSALPVRLDLALDRRLAPEVEATAYFMISEALSNAAKHATARVVAVRAELSSGGLVVDVRDDGGGGAAVRPGSGLEGLADRLATLGARLVVDSGPAGTRLATVIPCG